MTYPTRLRYMLAIAMFLSVNPGCSKGEITISAKAYRTAQAGPDVLWRLPPRGVQSVLFGSSYYLEVEVRDRAGKPISASGEVYVASPSGQVLHIFVLNTDPGDITARIDTSGYTDVLMRGAGPGDSAKVFLFFEGGTWVADIPNPSNLADKEPFILDLTTPAQVPDVGRSKPLNVGAGEWMGIGLPGPPPVVRQQDKQMAIYFYHPGPVRSVAAGSEMPSLPGDIWQALSRIGIQKNSQLVTVRSKPWPN